VTRFAPCDGGGFGSESNWRWNVYADGLGLEPVVLFAHRLAAPTFAVSKPSNPASLVWFEYEFLAGLQLWVAVGSNPIGGMHFPYGQSVQPDHP